MKSTIAIAMAMIASAGGAQAQLTQSTFDSGSEGWLLVDRFPFDSFDVVSMREPTFVDSGGNPGGYVLGSDGPGDWYWRAPASFLGNQSAAYGGILSFDLFSNRAQTPAALHYSVILNGDGVTTYAFFTSLESTDWTHFNIRLQEGTLQNGVQWMNADTSLPATAADMTTVLGSLSFLDIAGEFGEGFDIGGLDNVQMVPEPSTWAMLGIGTGLLVLLARRERIQRHGSGPVAS